MKKDWRSFKQETIHVFLFEGIRTKFLDYFFTHTEICHLEEAFKSLQNAFAVQVLLKII